MLALDTIGQSGVPLPVLAVLFPLLIQLASDGRLAVQVQRAEPVPGDAVLLVAAELLLVAVWVAVDFGDFALLRILEQVWVVPAFC